MQEVEKNIYSSSCPECGSKSLAFKKHSAKCSSCDWNGSKDDLDKEKIGERSDEYVKELKERLSNQEKEAEEAQKLAWS